MIACLVFQGSTLKSLTLRFSYIPSIVPAPNSKPRHQSEHPTRQSLWYDQGDKQVKQVYQLTFSVLSPVFALSQERADQ